MGGTDERVIRVGEVDIAYTDTGGAGRPVVLVHGFTGSRDDWTEVVEPLSARTGRVVTYDLRGHGNSTNVGRRSAYEFPLLVDELLGFLDALGVDSCDAVGHSLGGLLLVSAATRQPKRFSSLVLMDTPARPTVKNMSALLDGGSFVERLGGMRLLVAARVTNAIALVGGMRMLTPFFVRSARVGPPAMRASREAIGPELFDERARVKVRSMDTHAFLRIGDHLTEFPPIHRELQAIDCPTLVMVGEQDVTFLALAHEVLDALVDGGNAATIAVIPGAAHSAQLENTPAWLDAIADHVLRARGPQAGATADG
jgi:pimeloyl-ACP methyl ester carboxylesterase